MKHSDVFGDAIKALRNSQSQDLLALSEILIKSDHAPFNAPGYMMRAMAYELGGQGIERDLERAASNYRKAAYLVPDAITFLYLARVLMKQGGEQHRNALRYIDEAKVLRMVPEVNLAYARYYEGGDDPDYVKAQHYYLRAALAGRFAGFFGYSAASRQMGQHVRACVVVGLLIIAFPFLLLLLGKKARRTL
ncbi:hypothetical protein [Xanthomonas sp. 60]